MALALVGIGSLLLAAGLLAQSEPAPETVATTTIEVSLRLETGGSIRGLVVDQNDEAIVVVQSDTPYAFAWAEIECGSAFTAMREWMEFQRGGRDLMTGKDHVALGMFALSRQRPELAVSCFQRAAKLDESLSAVGREAMRAYQEQKGSRRSLDEASDLPESSKRWDDDARDLHNRATKSEATPSGMAAALELDGLSPKSPPTPEQQQRILDLYKTFGDQIRETVYPKLASVESDHFLIWTDWDHRDHERLSAWCEGMFSALCPRLDVEPSTQVFLAKCPVFAWRSTERFRQFAEQVDGYSAINSVGYTRSDFDTGHVHVVVLRQGRDGEDYDRFAATLVHEGTHAFLHRLHSTQPVPHWVNEGFAELVSQEVLGERCYARSKADLLARQYVRYDWPVRRLLGDIGPLAIHHYPIAHSIVAHLVERDRQRFVRFLREIKDGASLEASLAMAFDGLTLDGLERSWREAIRLRDDSSVTP